LTCRLCEERGKTWNGDDPVCAFENGVFSEDNWNCATMNKLRHISKDIETYMRDDMSCGSIGYVPMDNDYAPDDFDTLGGYILMTWYKDRGRTNKALFMNDNEILPLTIKHAELAIKNYEKRFK
jgi:hypothetical protein